MTMSITAKPVRITTCGYEDGGVRVELQAEFDTEAQRGEFLDLFPKSYRLRPNKLYRDQRVGSRAVPIVEGTYYTCW